MTTSYLPPNASDFERAVETVMAIDARIGDVAPIRRVKLDAYPPLVPWLLWEYGLGELLPYLDDPARAIREGVLWQRIRGTPRGLVVALSWRGMEGARVEEGEAGTRHFADFQVAPGKIASDAEVADIIALSRLAAPARARLSRIFHGYDVRRLRLSRGGRLDRNLLSDYSGICGPDGVRLSFGRRVGWEAAAPEAVIAFVASPVRSYAARWRDRFIMDASRMDGERPARPPEIIHSKLHTISNGEPLAEPFGLLPRRHFAKATVVLSDGARLGSVNACFPPRLARHEGPTLRLSRSGAALSDYRSRIVYVSVPERFARITCADSDYDGTEASAGRAVVHGWSVHPARRFPTLSKRNWYRHTTDTALTKEGGAVESKYAGQFWTGVKWPAQTWRDVREVVSFAHSTTTE